MVMLMASEDNADLFAAIKSGTQGYLFNNLRADALAEVIAYVLEHRLVSPSEGRPPSG
jgi:DNA-binding NarL/FixJ family response regulator